MTEVRTIARQIQQLEIYLNHLVSALTRGELPVNLQPITQVFDNAIAAIPPVLNLQQERFIELYNDLPNLFTAYAIDVTLSDDSYHRQTNEILFHRFLRGNYWIIPLQAVPDKGWLVPNPTKGLSLDRLPSLGSSFEREIVPNNSSNNCLLVAPALVQILPIVEPLTWKLIERGKITNTQVQSSTATTSTIESLVQKLVSLNERILQIEHSAITPETIKTIVDKQEQLQSISTKIIEQLVTKQKDVEVLRSELAEYLARSTRQEQEISALKKVQVSSIDTPKNSSTANPIEDREIVSLKIEIEKLKTEHQSYRRQQDKNNQKLENSIKILVAQEITKLQAVKSGRAIETIEAEIVVQKLKPQPKSIQPPTLLVPEMSSQISPFTRLYNSGEAEFLRSYMISNANLTKNTSQIIELVEENVGLYWIVPFNSTTHYLVPKIDFPDDDKYLEGLTLLFDGQNDIANSILFKPAIVTITKANMPKRWKLEQKGYLTLK